MERFFALVFKPHNMPVRAALLCEAYSADKARVWDWHLVECPEARRAEMTEYYDELRERFGHFYEDFTNPQPVQLTLADLAVASHVSFGIIVLTHGYTTRFLYHVFKSPEWIQRLFLEPSPLYLGVVEVIREWPQHPGEQWWA